VREQKDAQNIRASSKGNKASMKEIKVVGNLPYIVIDIDDTVAQLSKSRRALLGDL